jgi:poly(3-hydroxyalkanoate) synthetase
VVYLVQGGQQVFMISWLDPDVRHRHRGIDVYGQAMLDALDAALAVTDADADTVLQAEAGMAAASPTTPPPGSRLRLPLRVAAWTGAT